MYEKLSKKDLDFVALLHDPVGLKECLYPENIKSPHVWLEEDHKPYRVRNYQFAWQSYGFMFMNDPQLSNVKNYNRKRLASTCYNIGSRNSGKSYDFIQVDLPIYAIHGAGKESCLGSGTHGFLNKVSGPIIGIFRDHPFFKIFHKTGKSSGIRGGANIEVETKHGHTFYGRNEKIDSPEPGTQFHGLHYEVLFMEEASYMTEKGEEKRVDSGSSLGVIERFSGIPDIKVGSPLGKILYNENNRKWICRLPQFVRSDWNDKRRELMAEKYNGQSSLSFKLNVRGDIIEGAEGFWDIERIKDKCLTKSRNIKKFDIDKDKYKNFKNHINIDRLPSQQIFCCADIGAGARPTEIIIVFYNGKRYKVVYNITLNKLTSMEQANVFAYIYNELGGCFIGLDTTTDYGILEHLRETHKIPRKHLLGVDLRKKIQVGFEKDDTGKIVKDSNGKDIINEMYAIDWAMSQLENLFYEGKMDIPVDNKFFKEFSGFKVLQTGTRKSYDSSTTDDYHQAYQVFGVTRWMKEWEHLSNKKKKKHRWIFN